MNIGIGIGIPQQQVLGTSSPEPFGGTFTWWANINDAVFSDSGGTDYIDEVPLTGIADSFEQPTAAQRPLYIASGLDGNAVMRTDTNNQKIYKGIDASVFNGGGTFAFLGLLNSGFAFFSEAAADYSTINFEIYVTGLGKLYLWTNTDGGKTLDDTYDYGVFAVHHFTLSGTSFKYYKNGTLVTTVTINQSMATARALTAFNYKLFNAEQGYGDLGDIVALTGTGLDGTQISNDYNNFWKVKYPSLP